VNSEKTKYMVMSRDQNAGRHINVKTGNKCFKIVEQVRYSGRRGGGGSVYEVKSRLKSGNAC
jgi:hypothetical protein